MPGGGPWKQTLTRHDSYPWIHRKINMLIARLYYPITITPGHEQSNELTENDYWKSLWKQNQLSTKGEQGIVKDNFMILNMIFKKIIAFLKKESKP